MEKPISPTLKEYKFLTLAYDRFEEIWQDYTKNNFYDQPAEYRFRCLKDAFSIYSEVLTYPPLKAYLYEFELGENELFKILNVEFPKVIRNIVLHFPFKKWDEVYINKALATWNSPSGTINKFFEKYKGLEPIVCKAESKFNGSYDIIISFPSQYDFQTNIYLKDLIEEKMGVDLLLTLMKTAMFSQLESLKNSPHHKANI